MTIPAGPLAYVATPPGGATTLDLAITATAQAIQSAMENEHRPGTDERYVRAAELAWGHLWGQVRGNIPLPIPYDLATVAMSAGLRICKGFIDIGAAFFEQGSYQSQATFQPCAGFLMPELLVIWRYRRRTA